VERPIYLETSSGRIVGSLLVPDGEELKTVVLIIAGSGPTDRDGNSSLLNGTNDCLKMLAFALSQAGFASVRFDKRGVGDSKNAAPKENELTFDTYVEDVCLWLDLLKNDVRFSKVAVIGHSEGALVGMIAASRSSVAAFVSIAGPARSASFLIRSQLTGKFSSELTLASEVIIASLENGVESENVPHELYNIFRPSVQPYLISWFKLIPQELINSVHANVLIVHGDSDIQVTADEAQELKSAYPNAQLEIISGMNHVLKAVGSDMDMQISSYSDPSLPLARRLVQVIVIFLAASVQSAK
jgi:uncharacterized protein